MEPKPQSPQRKPRKYKAYAIIPIAIIAAIVFAASGRSASPPADKPSPGAALQELLDGNKLYVADKNVRPDQRPSDARQEPKAVILACSDSRVSPTILFDQGIGSLFIIRTAGNTYSRLGLESIEYAVKHLHTNLIVVLGHEQCGAVKAAVAEYPKPTDSVMIKNIYPAVAATKGKPGDPVLNAVDKNAELVAERMAKEPKFASLVASGQLKIVPACYHLGNGSVTLLPDD
jgi:carbonic anhydrase